MTNLTNITENQISSKGVQSLADRPNANAQYGVGGLSSTQLKLRFDNLASFLAGKINELQNALASDTAADYIRIPLDDFGVGSLKDLVDGFASGDFANKILCLNPSAAAISTEPLQAIINDIAKVIAEHAGTITEHEDLLVKSLEIGVIDGKPYLDIIRTKGEPKRVELDDIFEGFVKTQADINNARKVYGISSLGTNALFPLDSIKYPFFNGSLVQRGSDGSIYLPSDTMDPRCAASVNMCEQNLIIAEDYTDNKFTEAKKDVTDLEKRLEQLESATLKYTEYSGVTNAVPVPENAAKHALVNKVGGMTYKSKNLIPYPYIDANLPKAVGTGTTLYGVTFTLNADRSLTLNGVSEVYFDIYFTNAVSFTKGISISFGTPLEGLCAAKYDVDADGFIIPEHIDIGTGSNVVLGACDTLYVYLSIFQGATFNNVTIRPMLADSDVVLPYSDNFEGLRDTKVTELRSEGVNLIPFPYVSTSGTKNGVTFTVLDDGSVEALGTATQDTYFDLGVGVDFGDSSSYEAGWAESGFTITDCEYHAGHKKVYITIGSGKTVNKIYYPMVNRGTTAAPYKPYRAEPVDTLPISAELRAFLADKGYGRGIIGYQNYIDFVRKVFVQNTYRKVFDGTEPWGAYGTIDDVKYRPLLLFASINAPMAAYRGSDYIGAIVSTHYDTKSGNDIFTHKQGVACADNFITYYDEAYNTSDISLWKAHLADLYAQGKPLIAEYAMAEPIEYDISAYLTDDEIEVEGGGTIVPVNEYNNPAFVEMLFTEKK